MKSPAIIARAVAFVVGLFAWSRTSAASLQAAPDPAPADPVPAAQPDAFADIAPQDRPAQGYDSPDVQAGNVEAFGAAVAAAEGTINGPNDGYDVLFGWPQPGRTFDSNAATDHPRRLFPFTDKAGKVSNSSAAGRYQINAPTYDDIVKRYRLQSGFTPAHQDAIFEALLRDRGALDAVKAGRFDDAIASARRTWASLPGAGYNQQERSLSYVKTAYLTAGGAIA